MSEHHQGLDDPEHRLGTTKPIEKTSRDRRREVWWIALATTALIALFYVTVISPLFHLQKTSPYATEQRITPLIEGETITVPLQIIRLTGIEYGSERTDASIDALVGNASHIWEQAHIQFVVSEQEEFPITPDDFADLQYKPMTFVQKIPREEGTRTVVLIRELRGLNGISYGGTNAVFVADYTSRPDFRVLAHELGHQLGLDHTVYTPSNLMDEDAAGVELSVEQAEQARQTALDFEDLIEDRIRT